MNKRNTTRGILFVSTLMVSMLSTSVAFSACPEGENRSLIEKLFYKGFSGGDMAVIDEVFHKDFLFEDPAFPPGIEGLKILIEKNNRSFDNWRFTIHEMLCDGLDRVVVRWSANGIHVNPWMGETPTGKNITLNGIAIYRIENKQITADWVVPDNLGFLMQIGVLQPLDLTVEK